MSDKQHRKFNYIKPRLCGIARPEYTFYFRAHTFKTASEVFKFQRVLSNSGEKKVKVFQKLKQNHLS